MIDYLYFSSGLVIIEFFIIYIYYSNDNKKYEKISERAINAIIEAAALNSGILIALYLLGKALSIPYLANIEEATLILALIISGIVLIFVTLEKIITRQKDIKL